MKWTMRWKNCMLNLIERMEFLHQPTQLARQLFDTCEICNNASDLLRNTSKKKYITYFAKLMLVNNAFLLIINNISRKKAETILERDHSKIPPDSFISTNKGTGVSG